MAGGKKGDARGDKLRQVSGDGFFYLNTHGGLGKTRDGESVFIVQSSSLRNADTGGHHRIAVGLIPEVYDDALTTIRLQLNPALDILGETRTRTVESSFWPEDQARVVLSWSTLRPTLAYDPYLPK